MSTAVETPPPTTHFPERAEPAYHSPPGILDWLSTVDHKKIGIMYLWFNLFMGLVAGGLAGMIRAQLAGPALQVIPSALFNQAVSMHATIMIFLVIVPAWAGFGNYAVPLMIGARDMAFPKINAFSFWLLLPSAALMIASFFVTGGAAQAGWTAYPPLSLREFSGSAGTDMWILGLHLAGISSILGGINFIVTILNMRAPGMGLMRMPLFVWGMLVISWMILLATPVVAGAITMVLTDRSFGTSFFKPAEGGDPLLYQHLFWFYSHPAVYIMVLPGFGMMSHVLASFSKKRIFGYTGMVFAIAMIAVIGFLVWAHHMYTTGLAPWFRMYITFMTMLISVPTGIKMFSWLATIWGGTIRFTVPMMFALGFLALFLLGGMSGLFLATVPFDIQVHDSYFVVAHLHYVLFGGAMMSMLGTAYFMFPKMSGRFLSERLGRIVFWCMFLGMNITFMPMHITGLEGMARRVWQYRPEFQTLTQLSSVGYLFMLAGGLVFIYSIIDAVRRRPTLGPDPWNVNDIQQDLMWMIPSPPPAHNFDKIPPVHPWHD